MKRTGKALSVTAMASALLILSACGTAKTGEDIALSKDPVTLRVAWFGSEKRHVSTQEALKVCEGKYPNITIETEYAAQGGGYEDKLTTQFAAGNPPDVIQTTPGHLASYGPRGSLLDLNEVKDFLDLEDIPKELLDTAVVDGKQYNIPVTKGASAVILNKTLLEKAGLKAPDDENWTWDEFAEYARAATAAGAGQFWGLEQFGEDFRTLTIWAIQNGIEDGIFSPEGKVAIDAATVESYWQYALDRQEDGSTPEASLTLETRGGAVEASLAGTNKVLLSIAPATEVNALAPAAGSDFELLQIPVQERGGSSGQYFRTLGWSITSQSRHPAEAAQILNCLQSDLDAADILKTERGIPANNKVLEHLLPSMNEFQRAQVDFNAKVAETAPKKAPAPSPPGSEGMTGSMERLTSEVLFKRLTPAEAAKQFIGELESGLKSAG